MSTNTLQPTPYPKVNAVLQLLLLNAKSMLGSNFVGLYLCGSLASGDFDPERSDIDFVVVTVDELADESLPLVEDIYGRVVAGDSKWARRLKGSFISQRALRSYNANDAPRIYLDAAEGDLLMRQHKTDWVIQRHILREQGVVIEGPSLEPLINPIQPMELRQAVLAKLHESWEPLLQDTNPWILQNRGNQAFAVLTMCRALYTLQEGVISSKPVAARWALGQLDQRWTHMIQRALVWQDDEPMDPINDTLDFIRYALARSQVFGEQ